MHIDDTTWLDEMAKIEKITIEDSDEDVTKEKTYIINKAGDGDGFRFRLTATSGHKSLSRQPGVQGNVEAVAAKAKVKRAEFLKPCKRCCCITHCVFFQHSKTDQMVTIRDQESQDKEFFDMLDKSWDTKDAIEEQLEESSSSKDPLLSMLCATNLNLGDVFTPAL